MSLISKKIFRGLKNASYLSIGNVVSQIIGFIGFIYIANILGPSDYGIYVTVSAFVGLFAILTFGGLSKVVLREGAKNLDKMNKVLEKLIGVKNLFLVIAVLVCITISFITPYSMIIKIYIMLYSFDLFYEGTKGFFGTIFQAAEKMQYNALINIFNRVLFVSLTISFLYLGFGLLFIFLIALFSHLTTLLLTYNLTQKFVKFKFWNKIQWDNKLIKAAFIFSILNFTVILATSIDMVMISFLGTSEDVGIYGVAYKIVQQGEILRNTIAVAFFPIFIKTFYNKIVNWNRLMKYALVMGISIFALACVFSFFSEDVIFLLFGDEYQESGIILGVLIFYLACSFFTIPFSNLMQATHNEVLLLKIAWIAPCLNIALNYIFWIEFGLIGIAFSTLIVLFVYMCVYVFLTYITLKRQDRLNK